MTKKQITVGEPKISNIPIPISDNPVVIDLPDGQKLVLGKLNSGSVIEVATWRGTGRPDSRTNRLMLGMTDGTTAASTTATTEIDQTKVSEKKLSLPWGNFSLPVGKFPKLEVKVLKNILLGLISGLKKALERSRELSPIETTAELDINAWIESISREAEEKSAKARKSIAAKTPPSTTSKATRKKR